MPFTKKIVIRIIFACNLESETRVLSTVSAERYYSRACDIVQVYMQTEARLCIQTRLLHLYLQYEEQHVNEEIISCK